MSASLSQRHRAFLTQSAHSTGCASGVGSGGGFGSLRPATAVSMATAGDSSRLQDGSATSFEQRSPAALLLGLPATADEARARMASARRSRQAEAAAMSPMLRDSRQLGGYSRARFEETLGEAQAQARASTAVTQQQPQQQQHHRREASAPAVVSKCVLSPYVTVTSRDTFAEDASSTTPPDSVVDDESTWATAAADGRQRQRAQLMSQLRLRQPRQPARLRHDRTAQELVQEGGLPSRGALVAFPWPPGYKYTPYPEPRLLDWARQERSRLEERQRLAEEFSIDDDARPPTPEPPPPELQLTNVVDDADADAEKPASGDEAVDDATAAVGPVEAAATLAAPQQQPHGHRPRSGRSKAPGSKRGHHHQQHHLTPQQLLEQQQQRQQAEALWRRRNFSVSTIGEDEREQNRGELQQMAEICQRLRDRQQAREAAAAAAAAAVAAAAAAEAAAAAAAAAPPPPVPAAEPPAQQGKSKKRPKSATGGKKKKAAPASASGNKKRSGSAKSSSSGGSTRPAGRKQQPKLAKAEEAPSPKSLSSATSPRAKSPKGRRAKATVGKGKKKEASKKKQQSQPQPPAPPAPQEPTPESLEPPPPDPLDLLADEIEAAEIFHRVKSAGELPDFPCPSSELKSRQQLAKQWWMRQMFQTGPVRPSVLG